MIENIVLSWVYYWIMVLRDDLYIFITPKIWSIASNIAIALYLSWKMSRKFQWAVQIRINCSSEFHQHWDQIEVNLSLVSAHALPGLPTQNYTLKIIEVRAEPAQLLQWPGHRGQVDRSTPVQRAWRGNILKSWGMGLWI